MLDTGRVPLTGEPLAWFRQGLACMTAGKVENAVAYYNHVIRVRPDFWEAWYERGIALEELGFFAEAVDSYERALAHTPSAETEVEIWHHRGNVFQYGLGDYEAAIACYDRVVQRNTLHVLAWHHRGNALLYGLKRPEAAIACYQTALEIDPNHAVSWRNYGNALVELKQYEAAIVKYDQALLLQPDDQIAYQARLLAAQQGGLTLQPPTTKPIWQEPTRNGSSRAAEEIHAPPQAISLAANPLQRPPCPSLVLEDEEGCREITLTQAFYTIGRDPRNDICLRSQFASRFHAVLQQTQTEHGSSYRIRDGNREGKPSTNGLIINGQRASHKDLQEGDTIVFGPKTQATFYC